MLSVRTSLVHMRGFLRLVVLSVLTLGVASAENTRQVTLFNDASAASLQPGGGFGPGQAPSNSTGYDFRGTLFATISAGGSNTITFACSAPPCPIQLSQALPPIFETATTGQPANSSFILTIDGGTASGGGDTSGGDPGAGGFGDGGGSATAHAGATLTLGTGWGTPFGVAVDGKGNVYVADRTQNAVKEILAVDGTIPVTNPTILTLGSGFGNPIGVAVDGNGNVYVVDNQHSAIKEIVAVDGTIPPSNPTILTLASGFSSPSGVAVDGNGNVYVADTGNTAVKEIVAINGAIPPSNPTILTLGNGFNYPLGVAVDSNGNVYVADGFHTSIIEILAVNGAIPANPTMVALGRGFLPAGVAVDNNGNVFVGGPNGNSSVKEITSGTQKFSVTAVGSSGPSLEVAFTFDSGGPLAATPYVTLTQGAQNLDFNAAGMQTATQCVTGHSYNAGDTCTVDVTFAPTWAR